MNWKIIKNYINYEVSENGDIRNNKTMNILKQNICDGYYGVTIRPTGRKGKAIRFRIHRILAETFVPNLDNKPEVNHIDGNKLNNSLNNLEWCTGSENMQHAAKNNLIKFYSGENNSNSKLTEDIIKEIKENVIPGSREFGYRAMSRKYKISSNSIIKACSPNVSIKSWKHLNK